MVKSALSLLNLARLARIAAFLLFLTPWATASCAPGPAAQNMAASAADDARWTLSATGLDLAAGAVAIESGIPLDTMPSLPLTGTSAAALAGALLILLSLGATLLPRRNARLIAPAAAALAAAALAFAVLDQFPAALHAWAAAGARGHGVTAADELARLIDLRIAVEPGFWLTLAALSVAILLDLFAWRRSRPALAPPQPPVY